MLLLAIACSICFGIGHLDRYSGHSIRLLADAAADRGNFQKLTDTEVHSAAYIIKHESNGDPTCHYVTSREDSYGLFQRNQKVNGKASKCPIEQWIWAQGYMERRYKTWERAESFKRREGWW